MKLLNLLLIVSLLIIGKNAYSDILPENYHNVDKCVKITNIGDFPDITLVGYIYMGVPYRIYAIESSECLENYYWACSFDIFAANKNYLTGKDITKIDWPNDNNAFKANIQVSSYNLKMHDSIPISAINEYYRIMGFTETSLILHKWKEVKVFNNGSPDLISTFTYEGDSTILFKSLILNVPLNKNNQSFELYPNPSNKNVNININNQYKGSIAINIYSSDGKVIKVLSAEKNGEIFNYSIPFDGLSKGTYFVNIKMDQTIETKKIFLN